MVTPLSVLLDLLVFGLVAACVLAEGCQLLRWLRVRPGCLSAELALGGAVGLGTTAYLVWALAAAHMLYPPVGWAVVVLLGAVGSRQLWALARRLVARVRERPAPLLTWDTVLWLYVGVWLVAGIIRALAPSIANDWDSLQYHLAFPAIYVRKHGLVQLPFSSHSYFPFTMEMLYTLGLLLRGAAVAKLFHWLTVALTLGVLLAWGRTLGSPRTGLVAGSLYLSTPVVFSEVGTGYIDLAIAFYTLAAVYAFHRWTTEPTARWSVVAGLLGGFCLGLKYTGAVTVGFLGLAGLLRLRRLPAGAWRQWAVLCVAAAVVGGPWYVKNQLQVSNPVYPFAYEVFGGVRWDQELADTYSKEQHTYGTGRGLTDLLAVLWHVTMWPWNHDPARGLRYEVQPVSTSTPGPLYLALLVPFLFLRPKPGPVRLVAFAALFHFLAWFALMHYLRYLFPSLAMLCFCLAWALRRGRQWSSRFGAVATGATALWLVGGLWFGVSLTTGPARVVTGRVSAEEYTSRGLEMFQAAQFINRYLPENARLITYGEPRGFYIRRDYLWGEPHHSRTLNYTGVDTPAELLRLFAKHNLTHVLVNLNYFNCEPLLAPKDLVDVPSVVADIFDSDNALTQALRDLEHAPVAEVEAYRVNTDTLDPALGPLLTEWLNEFVLTLPLARAKELAESLGQPDLVARYAAGRNPSAPCPTLNRGLVDVAFSGAVSKRPDLAMLVSAAAESGALAELYRDRKMRLYAVQGP